MAQDEAISVHLMIIGALIASIGDLSFDPKGYLLTAGNCIVTSLYLVYIPKKEREVHLNSWGLLFYNNLLSIPMVIFPVVLWEWPSLRAYPFWTDPGFQVPLSSSFSLFFLPRILFDQMFSIREICSSHGLRAVHVPGVGSAGAAAELHDVPVFDCQQPSRDKYHWAAEESAANAGGPIHVRRRHAHAASQHRPRCLFVRLQLVWIH
jgi:hypothetical protein